MPCLYHAESPKRAKGGNRHIYIKGVTVRFGFDDRRTSQIQQYVKNKATGTSYGMYYIHLSITICLHTDSVMVLYIYISVWLSALLVSAYWAMRRPFYRGTSDRLAPRFFIPVGIVKPAFDGCHEKAYISRQLFHSCYI